MNLIKTSALVAGLAVVGGTAQAGVIFGPTDLTVAGGGGAEIGTSGELDGSGSTVVITYTMTNNGDGAGAEHWGTVSLNGTGNGQFDFFGTTDLAALTRTTDSVGPGGGNHEGFADGAGDGAVVGAALASGTDLSYDVTITLTGLGATWATSTDVTADYAVDGGTVTVTGIDFNQTPLFRLHTQGTEHTVSDFTVTNVP